MPDKRTTVIELKQLPAPDSSEPDVSTKDDCTCCDIKAKCIPNTATVWVVWLIVQLIASVLLLTLTGFQFALVKPDLCDSYKPISTNVTNATSSPSCGLSGAILALSIFAGIISIVDATANMRFLIKEIGTTANGSGADSEGNKRVCFKHFNKIMSTIRVWYCWILVHAILITIAANTYEWGTSNLRVLANTAMFFLTSVIYLSMIPAMIICYSCRRVSEQSASRSENTSTVQVGQNPTSAATARIEQNPSTTRATVTRSELNAPSMTRVEVTTSMQDPSTVIRIEETILIMTTNEENTSLMEQPNNKEQPFAPMLTIGLILSNFLCMAATLVVFFHPKPGSSDRTVGLVVVLVNVSTIWMILLICLSLLTTVVRSIIMCVTILAFGIVSAARSLIVSAARSLTCRDDPDSKWRLLLAENELSRVSLLSRISIGN